MVANPAGPGLTAPGAAQGDAYGAALAHMTGQVAKGGGEIQVGQYLIGYAIEDAEGMYAFDAGELTWVNPVEENAHVEVRPLPVGVERFEVLPACFVERHGLIIIIALGESIVGVGAGGTAPQATAVLTAVVLGVLMLGCLWWSYFGLTGYARKRLVETPQPNDPGWHVTRTASSTC